MFMRVDAGDLQRIVDQSSAGLFGAGQDGALLYANPGLASLLGYASPDDMLASVTDIGALFHDRTACGRLMIQAEQNSRPARALCTMRRRDGSTAQALCAISRAQGGSGPRFIGSVTDMTGVSAPQPDSAPSYASLYSSVPVGIYRISPDGRALSGNAAFIEMFGYRSEQDLRAQFNADAIYAEPGRRGQLVRQLEIYGSVDGFTSQLAAAPGDKRKRWVSETARTVRGADGEIAFYEGVMEDITARKEADALRRIADQAERANRVKSEFLASMSHELRTPLNGVIGAAHVLKRSVGGEKERQLADLIVTSGESLLAILNDILDLAKVEAGRLELEIDSFDPRRLVGDAIQHWRPLTVERGLTLDVEIGDSVPALLRGDQRRIRQVLGNFLSNALKFTEQGAIAVTLAARPDGACMRLRFEVRDSGKGVPQEQRARIFDKFYQLKDTARGKGGTGLGLAICREFASLMGGEVGCDAAPEGGACFWFSVPLHIPAEAAREEEDEAAEIVSLSGLRILAAEDNAINRRVLSALLENFDCTPVFAEDGGQALEALMTEAFDVVLMDIQMPVMDGMEVVRKWRAHETAAGLPRAPVIALTANAMEGDREAYLEAGMDDFVAKPIDPAHLLQTIMKAASARAASPPSAADQAA